jgi:hypothetical protein
MSKPADGNYYIIQRVLSPTGDKLAVTSNGQGQSVTLTPLANSASQQWNITRYNTDCQSIYPSGVTNLQLGPTITGGGFIALLQPSNYNYQIRGPSYAIRVADGGPVMWSVSSATADSKVAWGAALTYGEWVLQPV